MKKKQVNKIYQNLQKKRKVIKIRAILMACLLFAINSFAWFVFIANGDGNINADVISWDIAFFEDDAQVEILDIDLDDLYPGMPDFSKSIVVKNRSDLNATFSYEVESVSVYGVEYTTDDLKTSLQNDFPFDITFSYDKTELNKGESLNFTVDATWPFESENEYYKLNSLYSYIEGINYYILTDNNYNKINIDSTNFTSNLANGLYVESDDADTYWGEKSVLFKQKYPNMSAMQLKVKLIVTQKAE